MGKGTIKSNLGEGQYTVEINLDQSAKSKLLIALEAKIEAANQVMENLKTEIEELISEIPEPDPEPEPKDPEPETDPEPESDPEYDESNPPESGTSTISGSVEG